MGFLKSYLKYHVHILYNGYRRILLRTDKSIFTFLFNLKSLLIGSSARLSWSGESFVVTDKQLPDFKYKVRHQQQCNYAYEFGVIKRAEKLANFYFLNEIEFSDDDILLDCGANVGDLKIWFDLQNKKINYIGFEPSPIEFKCLKNNVSPSEVHEVGLWNQEGELEFFLSSQHADSSLIEPRNYDKKIIAKGTKLEHYVTTPIKLLKLEAEGAEPEILEGLGDKIKLVKFISADLGYERGIDCESTLVPVTNYLLERGFELINVSHGRICALYKNKNL